MQAMLQINGSLPTADAGEPYAVPGLRFAGGVDAPFAGGSTDGVRPNWWNAGTGSSPPSASGGGLLGMLQQIITAFGNALQNGAQQVLGGFGATGAGGSSTGAGTPFTQATLSSVGDPHLSLTGTAAGSSTPIDATFDSMASHADLFSTNAFGGYLVSTTASAPNAAGVTTNASARATLDHGADQITMNGDGSLSVVSAGSVVDLADGNSATLAGGATISRDADGAVTIADTNPWGRSLSTTFTPTGGRVDVTAQAQNVTLGGDLVNEATA